MKRIASSVSARYRLSIISENGASRDTGWFKNIVVDRGLIEILSQDVVSIRPVVGSGTTTPLPTDTSLASFVAGSGNAAISVSTNRNYTAPPYYIMHSYVWRFNQGQVVGNISEVGAALSGSIPTSSTPLFSRALIKDTLGNPTTITILPDEILEITYELYLYPADQSSGTFTQTIDGSPAVFNYSVLAANMSANRPDGWQNASTGAFPGIRALASVSQDLSFASNGAIGDAGGTITGTRARATSALKSPVNSAGLYVDITYTYGIDQANFPISAMHFGGDFCSFQIGITPPVNKVQGKTYRITMRFSLDRA